MEIKDVPRMTCRELKELIDHHERVVIVDTRENSSYQREHVSGAINLTYDLSGDPMEREMRLSALPPDIPIVLYCD
jgi:rhodanese-related sulfurtransferase